MFGVQKEMVNGRRKARESGISEESETTCVMTRSAVSPTGRVERGRRRCRGHPIPIAGRLSWRRRQCIVRFTGHSARVEVSLADSEFVQYARESSLACTARTISC